MYTLDMYYGLLLKEHLPTTQEMLKRECLEHYCERSLQVCNWSGIQGNFFLMTGAGIVNAQSRGMHWYLTSWLTRASTLTESHAPSSIFLKVFKNIMEGQQFDLFEQIL